MRHFEIIQFSNFLAIIKCNYSHGWSGFKKISDRLLYDRDEIILTLKLNLVSIVQFNIAQ